MIFRGLIRGLKGDKPEPAELPVVKNITIGRGVRLDPLAWRKLGADTKFRLDTDTLEIVAQGHIDLGVDGHVHRFYTEDDVMFQVVSVDEAGQQPEDFTLFIPWTSAWPSNDRARRAWHDRLSAPTFIDEGLPEYERFWFGPEDARQDPVKFWESVYDDRRMTSVRRIYQTCMLFARELPGEARELLLAIEMEPDGGDLTHEVMVGIPLELGEFQA